jgi:hypothetical protein
MVVLVSFCVTSSSASTSFALYATFLIPKLIVDSIS